MILLVALSQAGVRNALAEGSRDMYPSGIIGNRASLEWRTSSYGPGGSAIKRRTLMGVFANAGEFILMGSTAVGVARGSTQGDVLVYDPGVVTGPPGDKIPPAAPSFSCTAQRAQTGNLSQGQITRRAQELAGPDTIVDPINATPGSVVPDGYVPCFYQAPVTGIYAVVAHGPSGFSSDLEIATTGEIELGSAHNFGPD